MENFNFFYIFFKGLIFPSMTICHYNGFKEEKMVQVNMTAFNLMRKGIELWPKYDFQNIILRTTDLLKNI